MILGFWVCGKTFQLLLLDSPTAKCPRIAKDRVKVMRFIAFGDRVGNVGKEERSSPGEISFQKEFS